MATLNATKTEPVGSASAAKVDIKFEVVVIPVADVDRAKAFYTKLGWRPDADFAFDNGIRVVQFTPPGSGCSVQFGTKITTATPGSAQGLYLIVADVEAARKEMVPAVSRLVRCSILRNRVLSSASKAAVASPGLIPITAATFPLLLSTIRTATPGCSRKLPRGCPDEGSATWTSQH